MFEPIKKIVYASIDRVISETSPNYFDKWWMDVFETEIYCNTEEDFASLSETDLDIMKNDWLCAVLGDFSGQVLRDLGVDCSGSSQSNSRMVEEICELTKEALKNRISGTERATEVSLTLKPFDVYQLYTTLGNVKAELVGENYDHQEMIKLLVGNENNESAKSRLDYEKLCERLNNERLETIENIRIQLQPVADEVLRNLS